MPRPPHVSPHTDALRAYVFGRGRRRSAEAHGKVHALHIGDTWLEPVAQARSEALTTAAHPGLHTYSPVQGEPELLDAIAQRHEAMGVPVPARATLQVTAGATGALCVGFRALLAPGDEVLLPSPFWPLVRGLLRGIGAVPVEVPVMTRLGPGGLADDALEAALEAQITPKTAALYVNTPHNPTGRVLSPGQLDVFERVALRHGLWVFSDEVYEELTYGDAPLPRLWTRPSLAEQCLVVHSVSKSYALAGARVGWMHGPEDAMRAVRAMQTFHTYCAAGPMQIAAARALTHGADWLADARARYTAASRETADVLGLDPPQGGTFVFFDAAPTGALDPRLLAGDPAEAVGDLLDRLLDAGVTLTPGAASGADFATWLRLSFTAVRPEALTEALGLVRGVLDDGRARFGGGGA